MRLATVSRLVDLCMERLTLGKKNHTRTHMCNTCAHAYVRTCVLAYVRTHIRTYACAHERMSTHMMFSHVSLPTQVSTSRRDTVTRRGTVVCRMYVRTWHVPMCACAHVRTYEYAYDVFPA